MTHRERFQAVLRGHVPDRVPMVARLDIWHAARQSQGTLPREVRGMSIQQIEQMLDMGRSARLQDVVTEAREGVDERTEHDEDRTITTLECNGRSVRRIVRRSVDLQRRGMLGLHEEHFLKTADDYRTMIDIWQRTRLVVDRDACARFDRDTGDAGLPLAILPLIPMHRIMLDYAGYGDFYFHQADFPDLVDALRRVMEAQHEAMWEQLAACDVQMILHGAHWSSAMTPPPLFEAQVLPYVQRFTDAMHAAGKTCVFHGDADLSALLDLVPASGMDVVDCFACAPLVPLTLAEARRAWAERIVIWGAFPSTLLEPSATDRQFREHLEAFVEEIADGRAIIVGVSDNVMPDAMWQRIAELAGRVAQLRPSIS